MRLITDILQGFPASVKNSVISPSESYKLLDVPGKNCDKQKVLTHCMRNGKDCIVLYETQTTVGLINKMELSRILS